MPKVQLLRFLNLGESSEVSPPGDLRLWKALSRSLPEVSFLRSRVLCIEWPDDTADERFPDLNFWNEQLGIGGHSSLSLSIECDTPCLQRRCLGTGATEFETLLEESLREAGYNESFEIWEAVHFEMQSKASIEALEESVQKLLMLEARSGLFDKESEEIRFVRAGERWSWPRRGDTAGASASVSLSDLMARFKGVSDVADEYDPFTRSYILREQQPRGPAQTRSGVAFRERLAEIQAKCDAQLISSGVFPNTWPAGVVPTLAGFHRHSDSASVFHDINCDLRRLASFSDDDIGPMHWLEVSHHRTVLTPITVRRQNFRKANVGSGQLFALPPLHSNNALLWRRLGAALELHKDLFSEMPWIFSGRETWLASFRNIAAAHGSWQIDERSLRKIFAWEADRAAAQNWVVFASLWSEDRVRDAFRDFGFDVSVLGAPVADKDNFRVKANDASVLERSWADVMPNAGDLAMFAQPVALAWTAPDLKTPTYGFEKVSIFPDQYLLRLTKLGARGVLSRVTEYDWRSSGRAREVSMRMPFNTPVTSQKWSDKGVHGLSVDSLVGAWPVSSADPKAAAVIAIEACFRNLVARGVDPRSKIEASFFLNKPLLTNAPERDAQNFGAHVLAAEGFFETLAALDNLKMCEISLERASSALKDYECEPVAHLRGHVGPKIDSILPGFRMTGEALYAVGPRPAFMDIGSSILQHVRVVSNHVTKLNWTQQLELYDLVHQCIREQIITDVRPILWGGIAETLLEMGLWSGIGVQLKPALSTIELFSAAPGRFLVGILPQEAKKFESLIKSEWLTPVGTTGGEKLFGLPLERYREERTPKG